jgi:hypothetical protein
VIIRGGADSPLPKDQYEEYGSRQLDFPFITGFHFIIRTAHRGLPR